MDSTERLGILKQLDLFEALPEDSLRAVADEMKFRQYYRGEVIVWQGKPSDILYVLTKGIASVRTKLPGQSAQQTVAYVMPGTSFGEVGILESQPRSASVVALTDVEVLVMHREAFMRMLNQHACVAIELARGLGRALVETTRKQAQGSRKTNVILVVAAGKDCGQTRIGHAVAAVLAFKSKQPTVFTEYPDANHLRTDFSLPSTSEYHTLSFGHELYVPAATPEDLTGPAQAHLRMDKLLGRYNNVVIGLTSVEDEATMPLLEYANQILVISTPDPSNTERAEHISQFVRQHTRAHQTGVLNVGNRTSAATAESEFTTALDFELPYMRGLPPLAQAGSVGYTVAQPLVDMISVIFDRLDRTHQISVYIPTTIDTDQSADTTAYVERAMAFLGERFGGATSMPAQGVWNSDDVGLVNEGVHIVRTYATPDDMNNHLDNVIDFVKSLKEELRQEAMALEVDRKLVLV